MKYKIFGWAGIAAYIAVIVFCVVEQNSNSFGLYIKAAVTGIFFIPFCIGLIRKSREVKTDGSIKHTD